MTKIMDRVFSAIENKEDTILNQLENDIELAREDGLMDSQQYSIKKLSDNKFELTDKVNNEVTNIESDDNKLALSEPVSETEIQDIPLNSQVAWIDESDNIHQGTLKELNGNLVTIKPMSEDEPEVTLNKDQVRLLDSKTYAAKFKDHKMVIRLGEYDIEFDIDSNIARVLDEDVDCSWTFDKGTKMSELIKQAQQEINKCNSKPKAKKFGVKSEPKSYIVIQRRDDPNETFYIMTFDQYEDLPNREKFDHIDSGDDKNALIKKWDAVQYRGQLKKFGDKSFSSGPIKIFYSYVEYNPNNNPTHIVHINFKPIGGLDKEHAQLECDKIKSQLESNGYTHVICKIVNQTDRYIDFINRVRSKYPKESKFQLHSKTFSISQKEFSAAKYYILERQNPQLNNPYYKAIGKKTKAEIDKMIKGVLYGSYSIYESFDREQDYLDAVEKLKETGEKVYSIKSFGIKEKAAVVIKNPDGTHEVISIEDDNDEKRLDSYVKNEGCKIIKRCKSTGEADKYIEDNKLTRAYSIKSFNQVNEELGESLDNKLQNFAQDTSFITYTDIMKLKPNKELSKKLHYYLDKYEKGGMDEDAQKVVELVKKGVVKKFSIK